MAKKNAKKSPSTISWPIVKRVIFGITGLILVWFVVQSARYFLYHSSFFKVKKIILSSTLSVIEKSDLMALQGESLLEIDAQELYERFSAKYPQISDLRIYKQFPDRIRIAGVARQPFVQLSYKNKLFTLDADGIVLKKFADREPSLPTIRGPQDIVGDIKAGAKIEHNSLTSALEVIKELQRNPSLKNITITDIDVGNLSKITVKFNKGPDVIVDWTEIPQKSQMLTVVMSQMQAELFSIHYIDLRFKEPVIGRE